MAKGTGKGTAYDYERQIICLKYVMFIGNLLYFILAAVLFGLALWVRFDWDFEEWIQELELYEYWTGMFIFIIATSFLIVFTMFGCCSAMMESTKMLIVYFIVLAICTILEFVGAVYTLCWGMENAAITPWLSKRFRQLMEEYGTSEPDSRIMNILQEYVHCCGEANYMDYDYLNLEIPKECRDPVTGNVYPYGCTEGFAWYLEWITGWLAGIALFSVGLQIAGLVFTWMLRSTLNKEKKDFRKPY